MKDIAVYNTNQIDGRKTIEKLVSLGYRNDMCLSGVTIDYWYFTSNGKITGTRYEDELPKNVVKYKNSTTFLTKDVVKINSHGYKIGDYVRLVSPTQGTSIVKKLKIAGFDDDYSYANILVEGLNSGHDGSESNVYDEKGKLLKINPNKIYYWLGVHDITPYESKEKVNCEETKPLVREEASTITLLSKGSYIQVDQNN